MANQEEQMITFETLNETSYGNLKAKFEELGIPGAWKAGKKKADLINLALSKLEVLRKLKRDGVKKDDLAEALKVEEVKQAESGKAIGEGTPEKIDQENLNVKLEEGSGEDALKANAKEEVQATISTEDAIEKGEVVLDEDNVTIIESKVEGLIVGDAVELDKEAELPVWVNPESSEGPIDPKEVKVDEAEVVVGKCINCHKEVCECEMGVEEFQKPSFSREVIEENLEIMNSNLRQCTDHQKVTIIKKLQHLNDMLEAWDKYEA